MKLSGWQHTARRCWRMALGQLKDTRADGSVLYQQLFPACRPIFFFSGFICCFSLRQGKYFWCWQQKTLASNSLRKIYRQEPRPRNQHCHPPLATTMRQSSCKTNDEKGVQRSQRSLIVVEQKMRHPSRTHTHTHPLCTRTTQMRYSLKFNFHYIFMKAYFNSLYWQFSSSGKNNSMKKGNI